MKRQVGRISMAALLCACAGGALAQAPAAGAGAKDSDEIVVTAQRRAERLQDVPIAVTAIDSAALQARQMTQLVDIMATVPNLHASNNIGQGSATTVFIRGVGETESIVAIDPPVGFYVDDVLIARQGVNNMALFDIERIEVLRGPQGTLYGRNTSAGAIKVVTKKPEFENGFLGEASYGRFDTWMLKGSANLALGPATAVRLNAMVGDGDGDTFNRVLNKRVNGTETVGVRGQLRHQAGDVEINLSADFARGNQNGRYGVDVSGLLRPPAPSLYISSTGTDMRNIGKAWGFAGTVEWPLSDALTLKSITGYRATQQRYNLELTDQNPSLYLVYSDVDSRQFTQELQANVTQDRFNLVAGLYYFNERSTQFIGDYIFSSFFFRKDIRVRADAIAGFAQGTFRLTDTLSLIAGGRLTHEVKAIDMSLKGDFTGTDRQFADFAGVPLFTNSTICGQVIPQRPKPVACRLSVTRFTPRLGLEYKPDEDLMLYASWTRGFKSGGWSARVNSAAEFLDFDPEQIDSYEAGLRSSLLDRRATVNLTGFYYDYTNRFASGTTPSGGFGIAITDAKIWGVELETSWRLAPGVRVTGNLAWQDNSLSRPATATIILGDRLQRSPAWQASAGLYVDTPVAERLNLLASADYSYMSKHFVSPQNFASTETGPINLVNASLGVRLDGRHELSVGCRNCFQANYFNQALPFPAFGFVTVYPGARASWTITARTRF
ncbi:TonB-dependent receptor [Sandaracinobacteroides saxicola]|uniref:TonB-dependent receptor n=1 Tax=Sandaracinobacteroides saxicola TaxID=2759707 RepID=A0A7G5IIA0_9SPHN|nr:TonB-dependent receptor [Sandaracinobacteroides saxicola]QMW23092.1 TonB-dependent receptor [Sandaracinobacteroides saxicola]